MINLVSALESHLNLLEEMIQIKPDDSICMKSIQNINEIFTYLRYKRSGRSNTKNPNLEECNQCGSVIEVDLNPGVIKLSCSHKICSSSCLEKLAKISSPSLLQLEKTRCLECQTVINKSLITNALGGPKSLISPLKNSLSVNICEICYIEHPTEEVIKLECGHIYDRTCLKAIIEDLILNQQVLSNQMICPACNAPINELIIKTLTDKENFKKFKRVQLKKILGNDERPLFFYRQSFSFYDEFEVGNYEAFGNCGGCRLYETCESCRNILAGQIDYNEQLFLKKLSEKDDEMFLEYAKNLGYKRCPKCFAMCEKVSGCNFMSCSSNICRRKTFFCYLCGDCLEESRYYEHFTIQGTYGKICNNLNPDKED